MTQVIAIAFENQWTGEGTNMDFLKVGFHKCKYCSVFYITIFGFGFRLGLFTVEE